MAITTIDGVIAGKLPPVGFYKAATAGATVAGNLQSTWASAGFPGAGSFSSTLAGANLDSAGGLVAGQLPFTAPGAAKAYLARLAARASQAGTLIIADRLWHNGGFTITSTSAQTINSGTLPARDADGTTNGRNVIAMVEHSAAGGAGTPTLTINYTNSAGTASRSATQIGATSASPGVGRAWMFGLQAGDVGIRSLQSLTLSATWTSGTINMSLIRPLASLDFAAANLGDRIEALSAGLPELFAGSVPFFLWWASGTTSPTISGEFVQANG